MKIMSTWSVRPGKVAEVVARFLTTGAPGPKGVKLIGRWHMADFSGGFTLTESDNPKAIYEGAAEWADLIDIHSSIVVDDAEAGAVLGKLYKK